MFLLYQSMRGIDRDILQAAEIDGAGHIRRMLTIAVPLSGPMILTATLIVMVGKWNEYVWPLIVTSTADMRTLPIGLLFLRSQEGYSNWGARSSPAPCSCPCRCCSSSSSPRSASSAGSPPAP